MCRTSLYYLAVFFVFCAIVYIDSLGYPLTQSEVSTDRISMGMLRLEHVVKGTVAFCWKRYHLVALVAASRFPHLLDLVCGYNTMVDIHLRQTSGPIILGVSDELMYLRCTIYRKHQSGTMLQR